MQSTSLVSVILNFYLLQEGNEEWFVLGEDPAGVGPDVPSNDEEISVKGSNMSDTKVEHEKERVKQVGRITSYVKFCMYMYMWQYTNGYFK